MSISYKTIFYFCEIRKITEIIDSLSQPPCNIHQKPNAAIPNLFTHVPRTISKSNLIGHTVFSKFK